MIKLHFYTILPIAFFLASCATNPVTGENELSLINEEKELAIGAQQYLPARQSQGGDFIIDQDLTAYITEVGNKLVAVGDRDLPYEFKVLNNSVPNAWAMPGGKISINRGLLIHLNSEAELAAVLGHEIVHAAAKHAVRQMSRGMLLQTAVVGTAIAAQGSEYGGLAQLGAGLGAQLLNTKYGRDAERESDHYGMIYMSRAGYDPQGAVDLQRTFVKLSEGKQQDWLSGMFASHPASQERVENNIKLLATLPKGGEKGVERYQSKLAYLKKVQLAYDAYDKGRKALAKGEVTKAEALVKQALNIEPKEAVFYGLKGDIFLKNKQYEQAKQQFTTSIELNPNFFYSYLQRGQAVFNLKQNTQAKADLNHSLKLLRTGNAYYVLGNIAQAENDLAKAKEYYAKVASNKGELGIAAYTALLELDLKDNPDKYVKLRLGKTNQGNIVAELSNPTPKNLGNIKLLLQFQNPAGR
ncbi:MAG TPA: peptidase M48, partial [Ghiorsea sp.]|nr:peptidase M48 [Ghiorsea sp.]